MATVRDWLFEAMAIDREPVEESADGSDDVRLSEKQRAAIRRGAHVVERYGGVLLADAVGLGKTRMAVAMARRVVRRSRRRGMPGQPALFVVPARLREEWSRAISMANWQRGRDVEVISHHRLSREEWVGRPSVIVVDEAHRFRNPDAKRSRHLAALSARSPVILVTATPVCTSRDDLRRLLDYFLGDDAVKSLVGMGLDAAFEADETGEFDIVEILEEVVIRRRRPDFGVGGRPGVRFETLEYVAKCDEAWLWRNLEPRLRSLHFAATGDEWPRGLLITNLLRMWESGAEALRRSLDELIHFHERWLQAAQSGRRVERPDFKAIFGGVKREQQVFDFVFGEALGAPSSRRVGAVREDKAVLEAIATRLEAMRCSGSGRVEAIVEMVEADPDGAYLVFTAYRAAAKAVFDALRHRSGVTAGLVTGQEAMATGLGWTTDQEVLHRFVGTGASLRRHRSIRVLVATDCLAEGVNLQGCSKLILADLPYSPVKLEQRIGRIARPGSPVKQVTVYLPRPASWADSLGMRRRLGERLEIAQRLGASLGLARATGLGGTAREDDEDSGPLAAMTREERLWKSLEYTGDGEAPRLASVTEGEPGELWARVRVISGVQRVVWLWIRDPDEPPTIKLSAQLPGLARLADNTGEIRRWEPTGKQWDAAQRWVRRRRSQLEAARLAPALLGRRSQEVRLWQKLRRAAERGEVDADTERLEKWRRRLLRTHAAGIRYEMEKLLEADADPDKIIRFVEALDAPGESDEAVDVEIVAALVV